MVDEIVDESNLPEIMMCPNCSGLFRSVEIYPLQDGEDIAVCPLCGVILEFLEEEL